MCVVFYNTRVFSVWRFFNFSNDNKDDTYHSLDSIPDYDMPVSYTHLTLPTT